MCYLHLISFDSLLFTFPRVSQGLLNLFCFFSSTVLKYLATNEQIKLLQDNDSFYCYL